ncbi:heme lyase CcmF/NrfE family subunit [Pelagibacteraceae bacterium]|nr:heme lyase CcmF/NrfE family subunit [Pelagibacteraceae bacterium]
MSSLVGFLSLVFAIGINFYLFLSRYIFKFQKQKFNLFIRFSSLLTLLSFFSLMYAYVVSDFSNYNVFQNSHSNKPLIYKISGTWGNHEGSMLLWLSILSIFSFFFSFTKNIEDSFQKLTLIIQAFLHILFGLFIVFTSNPFLVNSILVNEGLGLNPILQDPGLAVHPPILYAGYVGYSIVFSIAIAGLFQNTDDEWLYVAKKWSLISWTFLTCGIALGSYWAYYELGWGGWWFWDPVENISLMPWIAGLALVHSLMMVRGEQAIKKWIVFLSILCFSLSVFGTFLVRSGILTSVHSFAADASRGIFILLIFFIVTGFGFLVFLLKEPKKSNALNLLFINKVSALVINNILMIIATLTILLGTIYPIIIEVLYNKRISVGGPYFNSTVIPIMIPGFLLMSIAPILSWQTNKINNSKKYVLAFIILSILVLIQSYFLDFNTWGFVGLLLGFWIILASIIAIFSSYKIKINIKFFKIINPHVAHIGVGIAIVGITCSSVFQNELDFNLSEGDKFNINGKTVLFEKIETTNEINFQSLRGKFLFDIEKNQSKEIEAGKNYYPVSKMITSEAGILHQWNKDIYFILGDQKNNEWFVKVLINPFVSFIWLGVVIMMYSGLIAISRR